MTPAGAAAEATGAGAAATETDVLVVGAGLAGLRCARVLDDAGLDVQVWEAGDAVGGRIRTDVVDGHRCDRGFQLLNPAYAAVRAWVDAPALGLQSFGAGVVAGTDEGRLLLGDPLRATRTLPSTLRHVAPRALDVLPLARWAAPLLRHPAGRHLAHHLTSGGDTDLRTALDRAGVHGLLRRVLDRFLSGVVLDDSGATSSAFALLLLRSFLTGVPGLPAQGMQALPEQLAAPLGARVRLAHRVERVGPAGPRGVLVEGPAGSVRARRVVVATDGVDAAGLTALEPVRTRGVVTTWFATDEPVGLRSATEARMLHVDAREVPAGPLVNTAVVSAAAPTYAPEGSHLVQGSALLRRGTAPATDGEIRRHAGLLLGVDTSSWRVVVRHEVEHALPAQPAPLAARRRQALDSGVVVCGDHRDTASIQGALVSGDRAARTVLADL